MERATPMPRLRGGGDTWFNLIHLPDNPLPHRMRIPHQHPDASVTADGSDLWCGQIHRKEAADGLVTQIVKWMSELCVVLCLHRPV
jgi:hypothetical protein